MTKSNAGRAIYIVYSLFMIPVLTALITAMYEFFSSAVKEVTTVQEPCSIIQRLFRIKEKSVTATLELEMQREAEAPNVNDEILQDEIASEMKVTKKKIDEKVGKKTQTGKSVRWEGIYFPAQDGLGEETAAGNASSSDTSVHSEGPEQVEEERRCHEHMTPSLERESRVMGRACRGENY